MYRWVSAAFFKPLRPWQYISMYSFVHWYGLLILAGCVPLADAPMPEEPKLSQSAALTVPAQYQLTWADEFDNIVEPDPRRWAYDTHRNRKGWYNGEAQYYARRRARNVRVSNGVLVIEAHAEILDRATFSDWGGQAYSSGRLITRGKQSWKYGFFEIRARMPCGRGTWPAIWLLPVQESGRWQGGEIDIAEHVGTDAGRVHHSIQTTERNFRRGDHPTATTTIADACTQFHRYQLHWTRDFIRIGVDDRPALTVSTAELGLEFDRPMFLILNLAIGGMWGGAQGIDNAALPARLEVDYVRVYQGLSE